MIVSLPVSLPAVMTDFKGMCAMPMMVAECAYSSYTDFISVDYRPYSIARTHHFEGCGVRSLND